MLKLRLQLPLWTYKGKHREAFLASLSSNFSGGWAELDEITGYPGYLSSCPGEATHPLHPSNCPSLNIFQSFYKYITQKCSSVPSQKGNVPSQKGNVPSDEVWLNFARRRWWPCLVVSHIFPDALTLHLLLIQNITHYDDKKCLPYQNASVSVCYREGSWNTGPLSLIPLCPNLCLPGYLESFSQGASQPEIFTGTSSKRKMVLEMACSLERRIFIA